MNSIFDQILANPFILMIPFVAAIVGWLTNILALKMTFYPLEFRGYIFFKGLWSNSLMAQGIRLGWQGIIPAKAGKMTAKTVDLLTSRLISVEETFARINPDIVADEMRPGVNRLSKIIIDEAMISEVPLIWKMIPESRKNGIYESAAEEFPLVVKQIMEDVKSNIGELFDLKGMTVHALTSNKQLLNELFLRCGKEEFKFIERSGLYFGFLFGLIQMFVWIFYPEWWILPLGGFLVGYLTNWLALKMIFHPAKPFRMPFVIIQGLFIKRQKEVSREYADLVASKILTSPRIFETILNGKGSEKLVDIIQIQVQNGVDKTAGLNRSLIQISSGTKAYEKIKDIAVMRFIEEMPNSLKEVFEYAEEALAIKSTLREKMSELPPKEFVGVLRPAFQEDEWKLILTGCALGGIAGFLQLAAFFW